MSSERYESSLAEPFALSALLVAPGARHDGLMTTFLALATRLNASGHRIRLVTPSDAADQALQVRSIPGWLVHHPAEQFYPPGALASCAFAIYHALSAEPAHIIHTASIRAAYAAALATFAFTLRHPCMLEPAIVTTLDEDDSVTQTRQLLPGDYFIVTSERSRDGFVGVHQHLGERVHVIVPGRDPNAAATVAVYHLAWERRQRENRQALIAFEA